MSGFVTPGTPNLTDFLTFLSTSVQIPSPALPVNSPWPGYALNQAIALALNLPNSPSVVGYSLACYNGGTHILLSIAPDTPPQTYFADQRGPDGFGLIMPSTGLVQTAGDQGTSGGVAVPTWVTGLTIADLDMMKTPWGRSFLAWNQSYGPTIWGLS